MCVQCCECPPRNPSSWTYQADASAAKKIHLAGGLRPLFVLAMGEEPVLEGKLHPEVLSCISAVPSTRNSPILMRSYSRLGDEHTRGVNNNAQRQE